MKNIIVNKREIKKICVVVLESEMIKYNKNVEYTAHKRFVRNSSKNIHNLFGLLDRSGNIDDYIKEINSKKHPEDVSLLIESLNKVLDVIRTQDTDEILELEVKWVLEITRRFRVIENINNLDKAAHKKRVKKRVQKLAGNNNEV